MPRIIKSKLTLPELKTIDWENKKLSNKLSSIPEYPLTIIEAPLGYGKSINLSIYLQKYYDNDNLYWYSIYHTDDKPEDFWYYMAYLLLKGDVGRIKKEFEDKDDIDFYMIIDQLLNFLADQISWELIIVLDNYHLITNYKIKETLGYFIDLLPSNIHLILLSRNSTDFPQINSWKVNGKVLYMDKNDLVLNKKELEEFLYIQHKLHLDTVDLDKILYITEGWLTVVNFIAELILKGVTLDDIFENKQEHFKTFFSYLDYEILDNNRTLHPSLKEPLLKSSVFKEIDPEIYKAFIGVKDCKKLIEEFFRVGIPVVGNEDSYRYNRFFKTFLYYRAHEQYDLDALHFKAYKLYQGADILEGEFYHILQLNDNQKLASFLESRADNWIEKGRLDLLKTGLVELPENYFNDFPILYMFRGDLFYSENKLEQALQAYQKAEKSINKEDKELKVKALLKICSVYFSISSSQGIEWLSRLGEYQGILNHAEKQEYITYKLIAMFISGDVQNTGELIVQLDDNGVYKEKFMALKDFFEGNIDAAREKIYILKESIKEYFLETIYILILLLQGKRNETSEILWSKIDSSTGSVKFLYKILKIISLQIQPDLDEEVIRNEYQKIFMTEQKSQIRTGWRDKLLSFSLINWEAISGNGKKGINLALQNLAHLTEQDASIEVYLYLILGRNYFADSYFIEAEKSFSRAISGAEKLGNKLSLAIALFWLVLCKKQRDSNYIKEISDLLKISRDKQYDFLFTSPSILGLTDPNEFLPILIDARRNGIEDNYVNKVLAKVNLLSLENHPGYSLRIKAFGGFKLYRGTYRVKEDEWKRSKARDLLHIFMVNYGNMISREKLYTYLWGEKSDQSAKQNFYVTLGSLNKILEPSRNTQQETCFIQSSNGRYGLSRKFLYYYDVDEFEELVKRGRDRENELTRIRFYTEAMEKYKGDYLPEVKDLSWVNEERERLKTIFIDIAVKVMKYHYRIKEYHKVIDVCKKIEEIDPYIDDVYLFKMKSYDKIGERGKLVKTYRECREMFHKEMGIEVNPGIEDFYRKLAINN